MKTVAVIPCHNEQKHIGSVVAGSLPYCDEVVVVDDHSTDNTALIAREHGAKVLNNNNGTQGAGHVTQLGINYALSRDADVIVTLDGDGQHLPDEIQAMIKPVKDGEVDVVVGSRFIRDYTMPLYRDIGQRALLLVCNAGSRYRVTDILSGFRAYRADVVRKVHMTETRFGFTVESLLKARALGYRIGEVSITCVYHEEFNDNSTHNPLRHGYMELKAIIKWRWLTRKGGVNGNQLER